MLHQIIALIPALQAFIGSIQGVTAGGLVVFLLVELAKRAESIPLTEGQTGKIRAAAALLSALAGVLTAFADHTLGQTDLVGLGQAFMAAGGSWAIAEIMHRLHKADKTAPEASGNGAAMGVRQ